MDRPGFRLNTAYAYPPGVGFEGVPAGLLRARHAIGVNTSNTPAEREATAFGDPLETLWKKCVFGLCGVSSVIRCVYAPVAGSTAQQRTLWLSEVTALVENAALPSLLYPAGVVPGAASDSLARVPLAGQASDERS